MTALDALRDAQAVLVAAEEALIEARAHRNNAVRAAVEKGNSQTEIAKLLGLRSRQRVWQMVEQAKREGG